MFEVVEGVGLVKKLVFLLRVVFFFVRKFVMGLFDMVYGLWWLRKRCIVVVVMVVCF